MHIEGLCNYVYLCFKNQIFLSKFSFSGPYPEEWPKTCFQPENSYFTLFSPPVTSVQGLSQSRIWFYQWNVLSRDRGCCGAWGTAKNLFSALKQLFHTLFPTNNIRSRLNPMQNLILSAWKQLFHTLSPPITSVMKDRCCGRRTHTSVLLEFQFLCETYIHSSLLCAFRKWI